MVPVNLHSNDPSLSGFVIHDIIFLVITSFLCIFGIIPKIVCEQHITLPPPIFIFLFFFRGRWSRDLKIQKIYLQNFRLLWRSQGTQKIAKNLSRTNAKLSLIFWSDWSSRLRVLSGHNTHPAILEGDDEGGGGR